MFFLDKLVLKWITAKCAELGGAFTLGPFEGATMYALTIMWGVSIALKKKNKGATKK